MVDLTIHQTTGIQSRVLLLVLYIFRVSFLKNLKVTTFLCFYSLSWNEVIVKDLLFIGYVIILKTKISTICVIKVVYYINR